MLISSELLSYVCMYYVVTKIIDCIQPALFGKDHVKVAIIPLQKMYVMRVVSSEPHVLYIVTGIL